MANEIEERYDIEVDSETKETLDTNRQNDLNEVDSMYGAYDEKTGTFTGGLGGQIDANAKQQISNLQAYEAQQKEIQNAQTEHTINQINQQKEQAGQDYIKEGSGAYADYQKAINPYGVNAEKMAEQGMIGGGYSESSRVTMYNTYQNRVASARKVYGDAVLNYNNAIKDAQIANSATLAEIAFNSMQLQLEVSMNALNMKGELVAQMADQKLAINTRHDNLYQTELDRLYKQYSLNETARQHDENLAEDKRQFDQGQENWKAEYEESVRQFNQNQENWKSEFTWKQETDQRDYDRGVLESDRAHNATIKRDAFNRVMDLINSGASASITEDMLKEAGISSETVKEITTAQNSLKESAKSETEYRNRMTLASMVLEGYVPTDADYASAGLTDDASKAQFKEYIDSVENSAILDLGEGVTVADDGTIVGGGTTKANWGAVTNHLGGTPDNATLQKLTDAGILSITEAGGSHIGTITDKAGLDYIASAINNGHSADEAISYFKKPLADRLGDMTLEDDGGFNGRMPWEKDADNLDRNGKVKDGMGNVWTIDELYTALKKGGMSADTAKKKLLELQLRVGITKEHGGWDWWNDLWD